MSSELKNQQADPLWSSQLLTDTGSPTGKRGLVSLPSSHCDPALGAQSDSSRNEFEPRPVSSIGLGTGPGRESRSTCDSHFHLLSPNQTPPFHGLLSYKRARENSMVGTQMEASLARGGDYAGEAWAPYPPFSGPGAFLRAGAPRATWRRCPLLGRKAGRACAPRERRERSWCRRLCRGRGSRLEGGELSPMAVLTWQAAWRWPGRAGCVDLYMSLGFFFSSIQLSLADQWDS